MKTVGQIRQLNAVRKHKHKQHNCSVKSGNEKNTQFELCIILIIHSCVWGFQKTKLKKKQQISFIVVGIIASRNKTAKIHAISVV